MSVQPALGGAPALEPRPVRIGHLGIVVADLDRTVTFYTEVVGLRLTERFEYPAGCGRPRGHRRGRCVRPLRQHASLHLDLHVAQRRRTRRARAGPGAGLHHIAFELATPEDLLAKLRAVRAQGIEIVNARRGGPGNQPRFYIHDPDGNLVEFYWGIDQVGWEGRARPYAPIEEIDLERFDFAGFVRERDAAAGVAPAAPLTAPTALAD